MWSGFLSLRSLAEVVAYPSTTAVGLMLLAFDRLLAYRRSRELGPLVSFGLLGAAITLVHSFTAVNTALGATAVLLAAGPRWRGSDLFRVVGVGIGAFLLVTAWPFSTVSGLFTGAPEFVEIHRQLGEGMLSPTQLSCAYGLLGLAPLVLRLRAQRRDPLALMCGLAVAVLVVAFATGQYHLLRVAPTAMLALHVAFGAFVAGAVLRWPPTTSPAGRTLPADGESAPVGGGRAGRRLLGAFAALVLLAGLAVDVTPLNGFLGAAPTGALPEALRERARTPSLSGPSHEYDFVTRYVPTGVTVLTDRRHADRHLNWLGYHTVNPGWPNPWIGDEKEREAARRELRAPGTTPGRRAAIAERYGATCVLITQTRAVSGDGAIDGYARVRDLRGGGLFCR
ncbi:hypothetical protein O7606_22480 [Micromonospora sp. WMMD882]|uniref:hypothetical protein n=1 Tax=Micromonospora sp. WMMD882 TaxID=3015151 RepID=UPI00248D2DA7|nr:hypothetical protein [Micromonospora sp. WMMD882]WBB78933.1 hypothetical protein O7606_22480 [Micromonospora sp. WMMD882]